MIPGIPDSVLTPLGVVAIVGFVLVFLILVVTLGLFVPRWTVRAMIKTKDEQIDMLTSLRTIDNARYDVIDATTKDLKVVGETMLKLVNALPVPHNEDKGGAT